MELAGDGDDGTFGELAGSYRAEAPCYRLTRSLADVDDALEEGLLQAWRGISGSRCRESVRSWLYAIVTGAALADTPRPSRRELPVSFGPATRPAAGPGRRRSTGQAPGAG